MMESRKAASVTRFIGDKTDEIGLTMFGTSAEVDEDVLQYGLDMGLTIVPLVFQCACRHLDEFEDEDIRELIKTIADECFD